MSRSSPQTVTHKTLKSVLCRLSRIFGSGMRRLSFNVYKEYKRHNKNTVYKVNTVMKVNIVLRLYEEGGCAWDGGINPITRTCINRYMTD